MAGWGDLLGVLGVREKAPTVDANGLVQWGRMDPSFTAKCAVWADGRCLIARGYSGDSHVREVLRELRHTGAVPGVLREQTVSLEDVAAAWGEGERFRGSRLADPERVEKLFNIFEQAVEAEADDIAFERREADCRVFVIVNDRKLQVGNPLTRDEGNWMIEHLFYCKNPGSRQTSVVEQSFQGWGVGGSELRMPESIAALRCERGPDVNGEHLFARMFVKGRIKEGTSLEDLGFDEEIAGIFREIRMTKYGAVIVVGSTGDGKSTTNTVNMNLLMEEHNYELNVATVEDPVENPIRGALQIEVPTTGIGEDRSLHYGAALMHFVRIHPAVGMVGEIRDTNGARQVLQFVDSGHQIWTTLHAHSASGALFRLRDLGVKPAELTKPGNIRLVVKQTLVSALCPSCCREEPKEGDLLPVALKKLLSEEVRYRNPDGCEECLRTRTTELSRNAWAGYINRQAFAEWVVPDDDFLGFVGKDDAIGAWHHWMDKMGGETVGSKIWKKVDIGLVDPFDALRKSAKIEEAEKLFGPPRPALSLVSENEEPAS